VCADDLVCPDERPAVGVQLGGGDVKFSQKLPLKASEGESELDLLENSCVDEAKGVTVVPFIVSTDRFPRKTRANDHLVIMFLVKGKVGLVSSLQTKNFCFSVNRGGLTQQGWSGPGV